MFGSLILTEVVCCACFTHFAMDSELYKNRLENGSTFFCPNGHNQHFAESEVTKLKKRLDSANKRMDFAERQASRAREEAELAKRQKAAYKGQLTKTRNRIAKGVCPCCHRTFNNVAKHMDVKHPDFKEAVS